jgi:hypothetical protein
VEKANRAKGLTKNFKPYVSLKNGKPCSLKRHYRGALRQVVGYLDLLANKDPERFVWVSITNIREHCKDYSRDRLYGRRVISDCKQALVEQGIISRNRVVRLRKGVWREGFIVRSHGEVTTVSADQECVFSGGFSEEFSAETAQASAYPSAQVSA